MKKLGILAAGALAVSAVVFAPAAHAVTGDPCTDGGSGLGTGVTAIGDGSSNTIYIDNRDYATGNGIWIYSESNGAFNLQRGGQAGVDPIAATGLASADADPCIDGGTPDTLIQ